VLGHPAVLVEPDQVGVAAIEEEVVLAVAFGENGLALDPSFTMRTCTSRTGSP
jgi:hypothetical protein